MDCSLVRTLVHRYVSAAGAGPGPGPGLGPGGTGRDGPSAPDPAAAAGPGPLRAWAASCGRPRPGGRQDAGYLRSWHLGPDGAGAHPPRSSPEPGGAAGAETA